MDEKLVEVTQGDRVVASGIYALLVREGGNYVFSDHIARGEVDDHWLVQRIARHRIAAISATPLNALVEALGEMLERDRRRYEDTPKAVAHFERNNAAAIAALSAALAQVKP